MTAPGALRTGMGEMFWSQAGWSAEHFAVSDESPGDSELSMFVAVLDPPIPALSPNTLLILAALVMLLGWHRFRATQALQKR